MFEAVISGSRRYSEEHVSQCHANTWYTSAHIVLLPFLSSLQKYT